MEEKNKKSNGKLGKIILMIVLILAIVTALVCWILFSGTSITDVFDFAKTKVNELSSSKEIKEVVDIAFDEVNDNDVAYINVYGYDKDGKQVWSYKTKEEQNPGRYLSVEKIGVVKDKVILNEIGELVAIDKQTGEKVWTNDEYAGIMSKFVSDDNGNIYLSGYANSILFVMDINGKTLKNIKNIGTNLEHANEIKIQDNKLVLTFLETLNFENETSEYSTTIEMRLEDLINSNLIQEKTVEPFAEYADIEKAILDKDGNVTIIFKDNSEFAKKYSNQYKVASDVKKLYLESRGNGGYFDFVMINKDGTVKCILGEDILENKKIEVKDLQLKDADFLFTTISIDAHDYGIINNNGTVIYGAFSNESNKTNISNNVNGYTQAELEKMALDYYEALTGYRPSMVGSIINDDGTLSIQMYDLVDNHNSTSDWYTVDMKTAEGTNILNEKVDLKAKPSKKSNTVMSVKHEKINTEDSKYYMVVKGLDNNENIVWTYSTATDYVAQVDLLEFLQVYSDKVYINEHGKIVTLDKQTGKVIWENTDYKGGYSNYKFDDNGYLYLSGSMTPDLMVIDNQGNTIKRMNRISEDLIWPMDLNLEDVYAKVTFPVADFSGEEADSYVYFEIDDLKNTSNKVLDKEIVPEFLHNQISGFEDIKSFKLDSNGDVYIKFEPDTNLAKEYGDEEGKYKVAGNVKNIYALFSGNGGFGEFIIVKKDGTMHTLSSYEMKEKGKIEIKDSKLKNIDYVIGVRGFDAYYFYVVDTNGKASIY